MYKEQGILFLIGRNFYELLMIETIHKEGIINIIIKILEQFYWNKYIYRAYKNWRIIMKSERKLIHWNKGR